MAISKCPVCQGKLSTTANQCIHCGADVKLCPECESLCMSNADVCNECGYVFSLSAPQNADKQTQEPQEEVQPESTLDKLFNTWEKKDYFKNKLYTKKNALILIFNILHIVCFVIAGGCLLLGFSKPFLLVGAVAFAMLAEILSIPDEIYDNLLPIFTRNSFYNNSIKINIPLKTVLDELKDPATREKYTSNKLNCERTYFVLKTQFYADKRSFRIWEIIIGVFCALVKTILAALFFLFSAVAAVSIITNMSNLSLPLIIASVAPLAIVLVALLLFIFFGAIIGTNSLATKSQIGKWIEKEIPEFAEFYKTHKY